MARALRAYHFFHLAGVESNSNSVLLLEQNTKRNVVALCRKIPPAKRKKNERREKDKDSEKEREKMRPTPRNGASFNYSLPNWIIKQQIESKQKNTFPFKHVCSLACSSSYISQHPFPSPSPSPPPPLSLSLSLSPHSLTSV